MKLGYIIKHEHSEMFVQIPLAIFRSTGLSTGSVGLYTWLYSHEHNRPMSVAFIQKHFKDGRDSIYTKLKELEDAGFLVRQEVREQGKFAYYNYILHNKICAPLPEKPFTEKPDTEKPFTGNPLQRINKDINTIYTKEYNTKRNTSNISKDENQEEISSDASLEKKGHAKVTDFKKLEDFDQDVLKSLEHFAALFPERFRPTDFTNKRQWLFTIQEIKKYRKISPRKLYSLCKKVKADEFWTKNFDSIRKLRKPNKEGIRYLDVFMEKFGKEIENLKY
jgi:hypothetical protein